MTGSEVTGRKPEGLIGVGRWALWSLPRRVLWVVLPVELLAVAAVLAGVLHELPVPPADWVPRFVAVLLAGVIS
ncbi:MAG: hypothetical protein L0H84_24490, partial [Pseudonocardia sp.]|nr:hypothetical protein [Pseudonocardia sp.]